ncbi:hypothetical protein [Aliikangiella coralliicola]|uniref:Uncharacterized protein n=1 Tax=Aliikangiella coralliicola TaxID=2592383 RepID=A0A545U6J2_9GAMM|nr:hypothetical protein [Aliikangiella coralliicola]TQV85086.1 hypothetical protein FLL46_22110 [Aliikangiella coralliicola]
MSAYFLKVKYGGQQLAAINLQKLKQLEEKISQFQQEIHALLEQPQAVQPPPMNVKLSGLTDSENIRLNAILNPEHPTTKTSLSIN